MKRYMAMTLLAIGTLASTAAFGNGPENRWIAMLTGTVDQSLAAKSRLLAAGPRAVSALVAGLSSWDEVTRTQCAEILGEIGRPALPYLERALETGPPRARTSAIQALDAMNSADATRLLISASYDQDGWVRTSVAIALRDTSDPASLDVMYDLATNDPDSRVRDRANLFLSGASLTPRP